MTRLLSIPVAALVLAAGGAGSPAAATADLGRTNLSGSSTGAVVGLSTPGLVLAAAGTPGYCPTSAGTTVVVDFTDLGGVAGSDVVVRCATGSPATGVDALVEAGFDPAGTARYDLAFICRIVNRPTPDEPLAVSGDKGYTESCDETPPTEAHWHYFYARNGGEWQGSDVGAVSHVPLAGGFEGWSFQLNRSVNVPPRVDPERPGSTGGGGGSGGGSGYGGGNAEWFREATAPRGTSSR